MAQHYTSNTIGTYKFCNRCGKMTMHKVSGKKIGLCMEDRYAGKPVKPKKTTTEEEPSLF
jgi:hypothetical protein